MRRKDFFVIFVLGFLLFLLTIPAFGRSDDDISVSGADERWIAETAFSQELADTTRNTRLRTIIQYANGVLHFDLMNVPPDLDSTLQRAQERTIVQYANEILRINPSPVPVELENLLRSVSSRIVIQYANANQTLTLKYPDGLFGTPMPTPTDTPPVVTVTPTHTPTPSPTPISGRFLWWDEIENGNLIQPIGVRNDNLASACRYIYTTDDWSDGGAQLTFNLPKSGNYYIWVRGMGSGWSNNSFFISIDGGQDYQFEITPIEDNVWSWTWEPAPPPDEYDQPVWLNAGNHVIRFKSRESQSRLDAVLITDDPDYVPTKFRECVTPTVTATAAPTSTPASTPTPTIFPTPTPTISPTPTPTISPTPTPTIGANPFNSPLYIPYITH